MSALTRSTTSSALEAGAVTRSIGTTDSLRDAGLGLGRRDPEALPAQLERLAGPIGGMADAAGSRVLAALLTGVGVQVPLGHKTEARGEVGARVHFRSDLSVLSGEAAVTHNRAGVNFPAAAALQGQFLVEDVAVRPEGLLSSITTFGGIQVQDLTGLEQVARPLGAQALGLRLVGPCAERLARQRNSGSSAAAASSPAAADASG